MGKKLYNEDYINQTAIEIQKKLGTSDQFKLQDFPELVSKIGEPPEKDVNFYDYDGKRLYSYTTDEALELTRLPDLPDHSDIGLVNEGWNWRLEDIQSMQDPCVDVGCTYMPSDGHTRIHMDIWKPTTITMDLLASTANTCFVDWGDGSELTPITKLPTSGYGSWLTHEYITAGKYVIQLIPTDDDYIGLGGDGPFISPGSTYTDQNKSMCDRIILGKNIKLRNRCIQSLMCVKSLLLNSTVICDGSEFAGGNYNDGCIFGMNMPVFILPLDWHMLGYYDYCNLPVDRLILCSRVYITRTYGASATFVNARNKRVIYNFIGPREREVIFGWNQNYRNVVRYDTYYNRDLYLGLNLIESSVSMRDIYVQKSVCIPLWNSGLTNLSGVKLHVPAIIYDDMMELTQWNTTFTGTIVPYESDWQDNYERLIHISELISGVWIDKWGNVSEDAGCMATDYIPVTPGETLYMNGTHYNNTYNFYDSNKTRVSGGGTADPPESYDIDGGGYNRYLTVPNNAAYVRFSAGNSYGDPLMYWQEAWRKLN